MPRILPLFFFLVLTACAANIPKEITEPVAGSPELTDVQQDAARFERAVVRWGGVIIALQNRQTDTLLEISGRELDGWGEPRDNDRSPGRFMVRVDGILDDSIYRKQRRITVYGHLEATLAGLSGEPQRAYPLVHADQHYLWADYDYRYTDPYNDYPYSVRRFRGHYYYPYYPFRFGYSPLHYRYPFDYPFRYGHRYW